MAFRQYQLDYESYANERSAETRGHQAGSSYFVETEVAVSGGSPGFAISEFGINEFGAAAYTLTADAGTFALAGQIAGLLAGRKIVGNDGAYALAGQDALLRAARKIIADTGGCLWAGQAAGLLAGRRILPDSGVFALAGNAASLLALRRMAAGVAAYTLDGQPVDLVVTIPGAYLCGKADVFPRLRGDVLAKPRLDGVATIQPRLRHEVDVNEC